MKHTIITAFFLLFIGTLHSFSQSWMTDSLKWKETRELNFGDTYTTSFVVWATESINDTIYRRIHLTQCSVAPVADLFTCHLRAEGNQVFVRVEGQEYLLYDFDLEIGDVYTPQICEMAGEIQVLDGSFANYEVTEVSTTIINGEERRVISFDTFGSGAYDLQWIEGVGSNKGLFHGTEVCAIDVISRLTCFERNTVDEYMNPEFDTCCVFALSDELSDMGSANGLVAYPNPISSSEALKWSEGFESGHLSVFTQEGKLIYSEEISKHSKLTPSDMGLSPGLYHINLEVEGELLHQKMVVY
ncbi:T9SS type A sorting domain-containing protein [Cryomorphaceae bacterium 1068]|nr:T9SS type A sorting domain-containing protein [Cryomorphaceae bacterium 1068]